MKKITLLVCLMAATFVCAQDFPSMAIVGDAVGGWPTGAAGEVDTHQMTSSDGVNWTIEDLTVTTGSCKFRAENGWGNNWGAVPGQTATLTGTAVFNSGSNFAPPPGLYDVSFNSSTLAYTFTSQATGFALISLVGPAVGGWDSDLDMNTLDGIHYYSTAIPLGEGEVKWRQDHVWANNWGAEAFPSGTAVFNTPGSIFVPAGVYNVTFNKDTGDYNFEYPSIAIVGDAVASGWPTGAVGEIDPTVLETTNGIDYTLGSITLIDGEAKFRQENSWATNWGNAAFPTGTGTQDGSNILVTAGTYSIAFSRMTGVYVFGAPLSASENVRNELRVFPNPTRANWTIASENTIEEVVIRDVAGKTVLRSVPETNLVILPADGLAGGLYFATVRTASGSSTIKLVKS